MTGPGRIDGTAAETSTLSLMADPELPTKVARQLTGDLPELLARRTGLRWTVHLLDTTPSLDAEGALPFVELGRRDRDGGDVVVVLTDLPRRAGSHPVVADAATGERIGLVSVPALGALALRRRIRDTVLHLVTGPLSPGRPPGESPGGVDAAPLSRIDTDRGRESDAGAAGVEDEVDLRLAVPGTRGRIRVLTGMVRANRPWRLVPSLAPALAAAGAGAAFGVFYSNIWSLAAALGLGRQVLVMLMAVVAMVVWLIVNNQLWERRGSRPLRKEAVLSNASTVLTVGSGVVIMYALLFAIVLVAAVLVVPPDYLAGQLGRSARIDDFLAIAWLSCSMGTVAGALGSGFADEDAVRRAAYSRRELERRARLDQQDHDLPSGGPG